MGTKRTQADLKVGPIGQAYRGYAITWNPISDLFYVSKGGQHITSRPTLDEAKADIDLIAD